MIWWILGFLALALFALYLSITAGRLDRLHHRVETALASLDAQLLRRSAAVLDVASSGLVDPASSLVLADAAIAARNQPGDPRDRVVEESAVSAALNLMLGSCDDVAALSATPRGAQLCDALSGSVHRTAMSRRFYNDAVRACKAVRSKRLVRLFRLAGSAPWPVTVEMDDSIPEGFRGR